MKLYYAPHTRASRPRWLLEELGVPYELVRVDVAHQENRQAPYLLINPLGHVPALVDGDMTIIESAAICMYLADKFPEKKMAPAVGSPPRGPRGVMDAIPRAVRLPPAGVVGHEAVRRPVVRSGPPHAPVPRLHTSRQIEK